MNRTITRTITRRITRRQGITSVLAMLYLVLFAALAIGFYSTSTTAVTVVDNERRISQAHAAAEGGMDFMTYQLSKVGVYDVYGNPELAWNEMCSEIREALEDTGNMQGKSIYVDNQVMRIPADPDDYIALDSTGAQFRATIENLGAKVRVKAVGKFGNLTIARAVQMDYALIQKKSQLFDYGVAAGGPVVLDSNARIKGATDAAKGSVLSMSMAGTPVTLNGNASISGDISLVNATGNVNISSNASIAGSKNASVYASHIHKGVPAPEWPVIDTDVFKPYATNLLTTPNGKYDKNNLKNIRIKANTNPTFDSNIKVQGVIYIETPNKVTFSSNVEIQGVIVVQNNPTGNPTANTLVFNSNVKMSTLDTLPATADFPLSLRQLKGAMILAPKYGVTFNSNFGAVGGTIFAEKIDFDSNARGTIAGSVIATGSASMTFDSNAEILIASTGTTNHPAGIKYESNYAPLRDTYEEVLP